MAPRVRFAPSPTGYLHVGGARTALFNWLYARRHDGAFLLRIEDTDVERSSADMVTGILDGLRWLGLSWDEGPEVGGPHAPYFQAQRLDRYRLAARRLVETGHAYACYCSADRLREERERAEQRGEAWQYDRTCLSLSAERVTELEAAGTPRAIRFKVPPGSTAFDDAVHGRIEFDGANIEDFVILRSDDYPTYHLSVVVDDVEMGITDVIRGDDHISNTPKHVLLFQALGAPVPRFAHVPLILGSDKKRLSKRHGATSVTEYQRQGYLPDAMVNFLALLGWSPGDDRELMTTPELIASFALDGISGGNAVFNTEKLDWMNGQYIARMPIDDLASMVRPLFDAERARRERPGPGHGVVSSAARAAASAREAPDGLRGAGPSARRRRRRVRAGSGREASWRAGSGRTRRRAGGGARAGEHRSTKAQVEAAVRGTATARGIKAGALIHATRVAITGRTTSPGLFEVLAWLGPERTRARLTRLLDFLATRV